MTVFVAGRPAVFLGSGEKEWQAQLRTHAPTGLVRPRLAFGVESFRRWGHTFDLDNLASVVLKIVAADRVESVWATMELGQEGVLISEEEPPPPPPADYRVTITNPPTRSERRDAALPELLDAAPLGTDEPLGLHLTFHDSVARIGDFQFEGPIKALIDSLAPVLGGTLHAPHDHRIHDLRVVRGDEDDGSVEVALWVL